MNKEIKIEICLDSVESVIIAERAGADRVELCSDLFEGGLTPTVGTFLLAKEKTDIPVNVMIRPRGGDFCYSDLEFEVMMREARFFKEHGADALVFGVLTPDGEIDEERTKRLIDIARPLPVTFHRAFDMTRDAFRSLDKLISLGVDRVLTSGLEPTVLEGADTLRALVERAGERMVVMPGSGLNERNFNKIKNLIGAKEYHMGLSSSIPSKMAFHPGHVYMGGLLRQNEFSISRVGEERIRSVVSMK